MKTLHAPQALLPTLLLAPVLLPIAAWFVLLLLPAAVVLVPALLIWGIAALAAIILSASRTPESTANAPRPPALDKLIPAA